MKKRVLALVMIVTLMSMGVAYAAWSQTVTVSGSISTGKLEVVTTAEAFALTDNLDVEPDAASEYASSSAEAVAGVEVTGNEIAVDLTGMYPGVTAVGKIILDNTGTIPVDIELGEDAADPALGLTIAFEVLGVEYIGVDALRGALGSIELANGSTLEIIVTIDADISLTEVNLLEDDSESYSYNLPFVFSQYNYDE